MRIVVLGRHGQLGQALLSELQTCGLVIPAGRESADLEDPKQLRTFLRSLSPEVIVNAAAYTDVDRAENERRLAKTVNGLAPGLIAEEAQRAKAVFIHFSTGHVFDGEKRQPYHERDKTSPLNTYGETKLFGEEAIRAIGGADLIFRTSWVFGNSGQNFVRKILHGALEKKELSVVDDQVGVPTSASALAKATSSVLENLKDEAARRGTRVYSVARKHSGVYNAVCGGHGTWYQFADAIVQSAMQTPLRAAMRLQQLIPINSDQYPTKARRPAYSVLTPEKLEMAFQVVLPDWRECLNNSVRAIATC